ncbi:MAG: Tm-1-like ATP-binding domain-containing protein, partial [Opitutales bacterium]|nr:Tm-1-like ATP-binding domain-containing protein [Opitutales bacterium]
NPLKAVSEINGEGQAFYDPEADKALFEAIRSKAKVEVVDLDEPINSPTFAKTCAEKLLELIAQSLA